MLQTHHSYARYTALVIVAIFSACGDADDDDPVLDEFLAPANLEVSSRSLTIDSGQRSTEFTISNTGGEALSVDIESETLIVDPIGATLPGGTGIVIEVTSTNQRVGGEVALSWQSIGGGGFSVNASRVNEIWSEVVYGAE